MTSLSDYTVGWICALTCEYVAAQLCLDEEYDDVSVDVSQNDNNDYTLGRIGQHKVVIAVLPMGGHGTTSATAVARDMLHSFPNIRIGLMVGIGGGVPTTKHDIRLGDVVVSVPQDGTSGVFQYDFGKSVQDQDFVYTGVLDQPPVALRTAMNGLAARYQRKGNKIEERLNAILSEDLELQQTYGRPKSATDLLFKPDLTHGTVCNQDHGCVNDQTNLVLRPERTVSKGIIRIHYGTIASGNQLMKNAIIRDKLSREKDILCFEMEAAGLMNHFPCAVIRGICDYSDSHKNDQWQGYAALTAALYTKDLLSQLSPRKTNAEKRMVEILSDVDRAISRTERVVLNVQSKLKIQEYNTILNWFSEFDHGLRLEGNLSRRAPETGGWFLESVEFREWLAGTQKVLFCPGIPGAGKTMIASIMVNHLHHIFQGDNSIGIAFAFLSYQVHVSDSDLLRGLLKQLIPNPVPDVVTKLYEYHNQKGTRPSLDEALTTMRKIIEGFSKTFIVIDGLDEVPVSDGIRSKIVTELFQIQNSVGANIAVTSRPISGIVKLFDERGSIRRDIRATDDDVRRFITSEAQTFDPWMREADGLEQKITDTVMKATDGMQADRFLLAQLHLETLRRETTVANVSRTLEDLPAGSMAYHDVYGNIMTRISNQPSNHRELALQVLSWITQSYRPIRIPELKHALAVSDGSSKLDERNVPHLSLIVEVCAGLVTFSERLGAIHLVHYTASEYFEKYWTSWFPGANQYMATVLINYLSFDQFSVPSAQTWIEYHERLELNCLYDYAARYWGEHAKEAYPEVTELTAGFLRNAMNLANTVPVLTLSDRFSVGALRTPESVTGLHIASYFGIIDHIRELIGEREDPNVADSSGQTALHWAVKNGQQEAVEALFNHGIDLNTLNLEFESPLHYAASQSSEALVKLLINLGSQVEARNSAGETPLLVAARTVNLEALRGLLMNGADPEALDNMDRNALHLAITASKTECAKAVKLLLSHGVDFRPCDGRNMTPLHYAVAEGNSGLVDLLLEAGADINLGVPRKFGKNAHYPICTNADRPPIALTEDVHDPVGLTPLHFAACAGHRKMTEYLLKKGANPNARCYCLDTPLHVAIRRGLLDERRDRKTPIHSFLLPNDDAWTDDRWHVEIVRDDISDYESEEAEEIFRYVEEQRLGVVNALLESLTIEVNAANIQLDRPLHLVRYDDLSATVIVSTLLDMGADISACNSKGQSILHLACASNASSIVDDLLDRGCSLDLTDYHGLTALHSAVRAGSCETVQTIFTRDGDSARAYCLGVDAKGQTLLHHYLRDDFGLSDMVILLLSYGAKVNSIDNNGHTPLSTYLSTFKLGDRVETCQLLLEHGANALWTGPDSRNLAHLAACHHTLEPGVLRVLSDYGVDLSMKDKSGKSLVHYGAISGSLSLEITKFLHERNLLDLHDRDGSDKTPLDYALEAAGKEKLPDEFAGDRWRQTLETLQCYR
ncbi:ankyrin repeat-containing domain protein [Aspergillus germanicus]